MKKRVLTGIKPTGDAHIGNYFGALKPAVDLSESGEYDCFYFIADYHALTTLGTKEEMKNYTFNMACALLACGLDPEKVVFYRQSDVSEIFELNWILSNVTPKGLMNRAHAYKAIVEKNQENGIDVDAGVNMGLYNYPILMAADILMFNSDFVPVGLDQKQHIEIARDIANYFNNKYTEVLTQPNELIQKDCPALVGLDGRKMSKSYGNTIPLFCPENELKKKINRIVTDSRLPGEPKDVDCTLNKIYKLFATEQQQAEFDKKLLAGLGWGEAKKELFEVANEYIKPMREKYEYYQQNPKIVKEILDTGANRARMIAKRTLEKVKKAIGC